MSTGMRKWMEKDCPDIPTLPAEVSIGREELRQLRDELAQCKNERDKLRAKIESMENHEPVAWCATDETGTVIEALGMNQSRRFDTALYRASGAKGE